MKISPDLQTFWDWRAAMNFILGGTGGGLVLVSALAGFSGTPAGPPILAGVVLIATGLACVWFEIGRPARFLNVFRNPYTSWMSREAWAAVLLFPLGIVVVTPGWKVFFLVLAIVALGFVYSQARILCASTGIPAWRRADTPWLVVTTGLAEGMAVYMMFSLWRTPVDDFRLLFAVAMVLLGARAVLWWRWRGTLENEGPAASFEAMRGIDPAFLVAGNALPALAFLASRAVPELALPLVMAGCVTMLGAGWVLKFTLITRAAHTQGFALERIPTHGGDADGAGVRPGWR